MTRPPLTCPTPSSSATIHSCRLLRDAVRLGFRSSAGPFRSFGAHRRRAAALPARPPADGAQARPGAPADRRRRGHRQDRRSRADRPRTARPRRNPAPGRALPAAPGRAVAGELRDKFHIDAELVLPSTATRLERNTAAGQSLFDLYPFVVVSTDFIKTDRDRDEFIRTCPELVIVDEAHTCAFAADQAKRPPPAPRAAARAGHGPRAPSHAGHRHPAQRQRRGLPLAARPCCARTSPTCPRT